MKARYLEISTNNIRMAFIDSEMAKRRTIISDSPNIGNRDQNLASDSDYTSDDEQARTLQPGLDTTLPNTTTILGARNPATQGQLHEVDLGPIATDKPKQPREHRRRRLRLTKDGRIIRPRPRRRRPSTDIARDTLVEQVLHENSTVADNSHDQTPDDKTPSAAQDNDEFLATKFKADFFEAQTLRQAQRQAQQASKQAQQREQQKANGGEVKGALAAGGGRGPKLGGSRAARAAMVASMRAKTGEGKP